VCRTFITALLLSGNTAGAEDAVLDGIGSSGSRENSRDELLDGAVRRALQQEESGDVASWLPPELQRVLLLPRQLRQCFVLRVLIGLTGERCASLLGMDVKSVENATLLAIVEHAQSALRGEASLAIA
jgi:DNA-directed RNA polymerase specialized sigma24 family protein